MPERYREINVEYLVRPTGIFVGNCPLKLKVSTGVVAGVLVKIFATSASPVSIEFDLAEKQLEAISNMI